MNILSGENQYTPAKKVPGATGFDVAIGGTFVGTVTVMLSQDGVTNWYPVGQEDAPIVATGYPSRAWYVRAGFRTGEYTSGSAEVEIL